MKDGAIAAIENRIDPSTAARSAAMDGSLVMPGLTDLHVHAYPGATFWGIDMDPPSLASGVTTVVDAGSAGAYTFDGLARVMRNARVRTKAFLNIAAGGLSAPYGELLHPGAADVEAAVRVARAHPDLIKGLKIRASPNTVGELAAEALRAVRRAADDTGLPVMVHISEPPPEMSLVLDHLRAGDVVTHCFTPYANCIVGADGRPRPDVLSALERGVLLDIGHGSGSFSFPAAEAWVRSDGPPVIISTDLHKRSVLGPVYDMCTTMTKMRAVGLPLEGVLHASTVAPAAVIGAKPSLAVGSPADIAVLALESVATKLWDSRAAERVARERLRCRLTVLSGEVAFVAADLRVTGV